MNKFILIALLVAVATCTKQPKMVDTHVQFAELKKDAFGATFLSAIEMSLKTSSPVSELIGLFDSILGDLQNDQAVADNLNETEQNFCSESLEQFAAETAYVENSIASLGTAVTANTEILAQAKLSLNQAATDLDETNAALAAGTAQREAEHAAWTDSDFEHSESIAALEEASKLIKHLIHGVSFAQVRERYTKVEETLKANAKHASLFKPLISALASISTKLNYEQVVRILDLLKSIRDALAAAQEGELNAENQAQADWDTLEAHLNEQRRSLQDKVARLNNLITSTEEIIVQLNESLARFQEYHDFLVYITDYVNNWCTSRNEAYTTSTQDRQRRIRIVEALEEGITERFSAVASFFE